MLAKDDEGNDLGAMVVKDKVALKLIKGKFGTLDPWEEICYQVIMKRDGRGAAEAESKDPKTFWSDYSRLEARKDMFAMQCMTNVRVYTSTYTQGHVRHAVHG